MSPPSPLPQINKYVALKLCDFGERRDPLSPSLATGGRIQGGDLGALGWGKGAYERAGARTWETGGGRRCP